MKPFQTILSPLFLLLISMQTSESSNQQKNENTELICGNWTLTKTTVTSEKTIYQGNMTDLLTLNCDQHTWTQTEGGDVIAHGTWSLDDSTLELKVGNNHQKGQIQLLTENQLIIAFPDITHEYVRD